MREATAWLMGQSTGRRLCVVITDGDWCDTSYATGHMLHGARCGVEYVFIGLGMSRESLLARWPAGLRGIGCPADARILAEQLPTVAGVVVWDLLVSPQHGRRFGGAIRRAVVLPAHSQASLTTLAGACPGGNEVRRRDDSRPPRGPNL